MARVRDTDVEKMAQGQLRREVKRLRDGLRKHRDARSNSRCWHNDLGLYGLLPEGKKPGKMLGDEKMLLRNCKRYIRRQQCFLHEHS
ncbi:MAG: hypothetical protein AAB490_01545 [Patescibacteria group bacterium]